MTNATTVQAVSKALADAGFQAFRTGKRGEDRRGVKVRGHFSRSRGGRGVVCVHCEQMAGNDHEANTKRVAEALNAGSFVATFDPDHGPCTGVVFVVAK